ncbi:helix-turn-helix domain-containing protein [Vibrio cholerae]
MTSRNNPNRIKIHRNYTVIEVSEVLGVHPKTARNWIRAGLTVADTKRPLLINGADLKVYLKQKRKAIMFDCEEHEMCCFRCKKPMKPSIESVLFIAQPAGMAHMAGECEECGCRVNKYVSWRNVNDIWLELKGTLPIAEKHLILRGKALLNCPLNTVSDDEN